MELLGQLEQYRPFNEQEERDRDILLRCLREEGDIFTRNNAMAHMTASAWVVNRERTKVLMAYHNIYHSWSWLGGHADGDRDLLRVAVREAVEESGLSDIRPVTDSIYSIEVLTVDGHVKRGAYVASHLHLNVTYLLEADDHGILHTKEDENSGVAWFPAEEAVSASSEPWMRERIYSKLNAKMAAYGGLQEAAGIKEAADEGI